MISSGGWRAATMGGRRDAGEGARVTELRLDLPPDVLDELVERVADFVLRRLDDSQPRWLTLDEAAERYRISPDALRKRAQRGRLPGAVRDGSRWLVDSRALDAALQAGVLSRVDYE